MRILLKASNVWKELENEVILKDINLEVFEGDFIWIYGNNASGKSLLLKILSFDETPSRGTLTAEKKFPRESADAPLLKSETVSENIRATLKSSEKDTTWEEAKVLKDLSLFEKRHFFPSQLSEGERQMLRIATFLSLSEKLIFFDEPFYFLDEKNASLVLEKLIEKNLEGCAIVLAGRRPPTKTFSARQKIIEMKNGKIFEK